MPKRQETPQSKSIMARINQLTPKLALTPATASHLVLTLYIQEAFLVRFLSSPFAGDLDLGGSQRLYRLDLLRGLAGARPSRDIDFRCRSRYAVARLIWTPAACTALCHEHP